MSQETQQAEYPYLVRIEISTGKSTDVPIAFLTRKQIEMFVQVDFKRLVQEAGLQGARLHIERASTADYEKVVGDVAVFLRNTSAIAA